MDAVTSWMTSPSNIIMAVGVITIVVIAVIGAYYSFGNSQPHGWLLGVIYLIMGITIGGIANPIGVAEEYLLLGMGLTVLVVTCAGLGIMVMLHSIFNHLIQKA